MVASLPLVAVTATWLLGLALASAFSLPRTTLTISTLIPLFGILLWRRHSGPRLAFACALFALLGALRYPPPIEHDPLARYIGLEKVGVEGVVTAEPEMRNGETRARLQVEQVIAPDAGPLFVESDLLAQLPRFASVAYGDRLLITGTLTAPPVFAHFDYREYLARRGIHVLLRADQTTLMAHDRGNPLLSALLAVKAQARRAILASLPEPHASVLQGILLGDHSDIPDDLEEAFNRTSTSHILVISGYNLTVVAAIFGGMVRQSRWSWRRTASVLAGIAVYTLLVGAEPSVVRAAIMAGIVIFGQAIRRQAHPLNSLALASLLMTMIDPFALSDRGFLLSVTSTLGLILYAGPIQARFAGWLEHRIHSDAARAFTGVLNGVLAPTIAAQIMSLPLLVQWFGQVSLVALAANALVLPVQPLLMISGGLATAIAALWLPLGRALMSIAWMGLAWTILIVERLAALPFAIVPWTPSPWLAWVYYVVVLAVTWWFHQDDDARSALRERLVAPPARLWAPPLCLAAIAIWSAVWSQPDGRLHVAFLDVGQGDAIFITTPRGHQVLIDGGPQPDILLRQLGRRMPFWDRSLDLVILTHPDADHLTGLMPLPERFDIGAVLDNGDSVPGQLGDAWAEVLQSSGISRIVHVRAGVQIRLDPDVTMTILNPAPTPATADNDNSVVIRLTWQKASFLLTGDIGEEGERALVKSDQPLSSVVLKVAHHGSASSTTPAFLTRVNPQVAVISVGADNRFGHPAPQVLDRLAGRMILRTDKHGTVEVVTDGEVLWIETER